MYLERIQLILQKEVFIILMILMIFTGCSNTQYLPEGAELYTGGEVEIISDREVPDKSKLMYEMKSVIRPEPNTTVLGIFRPKLSIYNWVGEPEKEKGVRRWAREKFGEKPVLFNDVPINTNIQLITNRLENNGHFTPKVSYILNRKNQKVSINYQVTIQNPYTIKSVSFPRDSGDLELRIRQSSKSSLLQTGKPYKLEELINERIRVDSVLKNEGFFYFNPDYIIFSVDSTAGSREVDIYVNVKKDIPATARRPYKIKNVIINTNYSLEAEQMGVEGVDTTLVNGMYVFDRNNDFNPEIFKRTIFLRSGDNYSRRKHEITLNHLMGLGVFQFVNIRFADLEAEGDTGKLNAFINLTPIERRAIRFELSAVSKSNNFAGPGLSGNYRNRNLLKGAELFILNLSGNYETLIAGKRRGLNSYELGINAELQIPRFVAPFYVNPERPISFIPKTRIIAAYQTLNRVQFFWLNSFNVSFGYLWGESRVKKHELNPISLNFVRLGDITPEFEEILNRNPILRRSFENQLIIGSVYSFTFNDQILEDRRHNYFFRGNIDVAGHSMHLVQSVFRTEPVTEEKPYLVLGIPYSQYSRIDADFRYYFRPSPKSRIVARLIAGTGIAYGNARTLPYVKQFYIGGANSIRAFQPRSLGPGSYPLLDTLQSNANVEGPSLFLDQTGDMKLETNLEYRFPLVAMLKGAVFLDAGNIWTIRENPDTPGGQFKLNSFYKEIAVGTGFGLRLDIEFFVLRFDLGVPLRKPFLEETGRWVINEIDFGSPEWRAQSLVLNIAIGYPF